MNNKLIVFPLFFFLFLTMPVFASFQLPSGYQIYECAARQSAPTTVYCFDSPHGIGGAANSSYRGYQMWNISTLSGNGLLNASLYIFSTSTFTSVKSMQILVYNTSLNWSSTNLTWNTIPTTQTQASSDTYNITQQSWVRINITEAIKDALNNGQSSLSLLLQSGNESSTTGDWYVTKIYGDANYRPYLLLYYNDSSYEPCGNYTAYGEGSTCLGSVEDPSRRGFVSNYDFCHLTYGSCPSGTICIQYTSTNNWTVNTTGCLNLTTAHIVSTLCRDYYGNLTNCSSITTTNSTFPLDCFNTTTNCYDNLCFPISCGGGGTIDSACTSWAGGVALGLGSFLGVTNCGLSMNISSIILTLILAAVMVGGLAYTGIGGKTLGTVFMMSALLFLIMFTVAGWFPSWLIIVLIVVSALGMAGILGGMVGG